MILMVSNTETTSHCQLKTQEVEYLKTSTIDQTKIIKQELEITSQKVEDILSLLE